MKWYVVYSEKNPGVYDSWEKCKEEVDGYENNYYKGYKTKKEADDHYSNFVLTKNSSHEVCNTVWTSGRLKNLIIFIQFIVIMVLLLS